MENQEKTMRPIPKNVRQIGERDDEIKLYVEDYVNTFIRKCARSGKTVVGALIGDYFSDEGKEYLFVEGAVQADGYQESDGKMIMTDEVWSDLYGKISQFFGGRAICGWFICSGETENCNVSMLRGFMYDNLGPEKRALIVHNTEAEEEIFSVYDRNVIREQQGYYLFYERNEPMQSYMVTTSFAIRTDPVAVDAVTTHVRTRMVEKKEIPVQRSGYSFVSAAALLLGIIALASGIVMMNHYEQLREMEAMLTGLTGNWLESRDEAGEGSTEETEPKFGGLIIEDVSGNVLPSQTEVQTDTTEAPTEANESGADSENVSGTAEDNTGTQGQQSAEPGEDEPGQSNDQATSSRQEGEGTGEGESMSGTDGAAGETESAGQSNGSSGKDEPSTEESKEANAVPEYRTYLVERGDTLVTICWQIYGYRDDEIIDLICEINDLEDKDHIYAGQELLIP